jgi:antitoxin HicB
MEYPALYEPAEEGGSIITIPDFGWGVSQADTEAEAHVMATALLQTLVQEHIRKGEPLPRPGRPRGRRLRIVQLPALQAAKAELYRLFLAFGLRKADLARRLAMPKANVDRLFDLRHRNESLRHQSHARKPHPVGDVDRLGDRAKLKPLLAAHEDSVVGRTSEQNRQPTISREGVGCSRLAGAG